jgi:hypothetical protein
MNWNGETIPTWNHGRGVELFKGFILGVAATGLAVYLLIPSPKKQAAIDIKPFMAEIQGLREQVIQMASTRCMSITTPLMQMSVYNVENIGKIPLPPPTIFKIKPPPPDSDVATKEPQVELTP